MPPPSAAQKFLRCFCRPELAEGIQGDLDESFVDWLAQGQSPRQARWRYWREVLLLFRPGLIRSLWPRFTYYIPVDMWKNYLKTAVRQMARQRLFTALNVLGLAAGLSVCLLIIMMLVDQYSYDQFQTHKHDLYRVLSGHSNDGTEPEANFATSPLPLAQVLPETYPWVERGIGVVKANYPLTHAEHNFDGQGLFADSSFLMGFSFGWLQGDESAALSGPQQIVLTEPFAREVFGRLPELGTTVAVGTLGECVITGLMPEVPRRSHLQFDYLLSMASLPDPDRYDWDQVWQPHVFVQLAPDADPDQLAEALADMAAERSALSEKMTYQFVPQPYLAINPGILNVANSSGREFPALILHLLAGFASIILLLAGFNYTNLSTARALRRAREVSIRKVTGARRDQIVAQMLVESVFVSLLALGLAVVLLEYLIEGLYSLHPYLQEMFFLERQPWLYVVFLGFTMLVGTLAGWLPARFLSRFQSVEGLKKLQNLRGMSYRRLRKVLIVAQFAVCFLFTATTLIILQQKKHLLSADLGLRTEQVLNVKLQDVPYERFAQVAQQVKGVQSVAASGIVPLANVSMSMPLARSGGQEPVTLDYNRINGAYLRTLDLTLLAGTPRAPEASAGQPRPIWLNEQAIAAYGFASPDEAVGQLLHSPDDQADRQYRVVGVIEDFRYRSLMEPGSQIGPTALILTDQQLAYANLLLDGHDLAGTLADLRAAWQSLDTPEVFTYNFFDEEVEAAFLLFDLASKILGLVGILAVIIASLGLLGMVVYAVEGRMKEVGIRKVLGASQGGLIWQLSREFLLLLTVAALIALPLALFANQQWLEMYTLRIPLSLNVILPTLLLVGGLSLWVILSQALRAARVNPTEILQEE